MGLEKHSLTRFHLCSYYTSLINFFHSYSQQHLPCIAVGPGINHFTQPHSYFSLSYLCTLYTFHFIISVILHSIILVLSQDISIPSLSIFAALYYNYISSSPHLLLRSPTQYSKTFGQVNTAFTFCTANSFQDTTNSQTFLVISRSNSLLKQKNYSFQCHFTT